MDFVDRLNTTAFLGKEFATWIWFESDQNEGLLNVPDGGGAAEIFITDAITLSGAGEGAEKVSVRAEDPSLSPEARVALRQGKKVAKAKLRIVRDQREWSLTLAGETLAVSSVKLPALLTREEDEKLNERLMLLDQLDGMIQALFHAFVALRTDPEQWPTVRAQMQEWVRGDGPERISHPATAIVDMADDVEAEAVVKEPEAAPPPA